MVQALELLAEYEGKPLKRKLEDVKNAAKVQTFMHQLNVLQGAPQELTDVDRRLDAVWREGKIDWADFVKLAVQIVHERYEQDGR